MAVQLQLRRGTTAENDAFTGAVAEVTVDTDTHELRVHDGATAGGFTVAGKADMTTALANKANTDLDNLSATGLAVLAGKADVATTLAGYGITDGANTDLSNLTLTGEAKFAAKANTDMGNLTDTGKNISNWSSNVTNCITEIPQDINLELNAGTLTLKAGSKVYVPNGSGVFNELTITNDISDTPSAGTAKYLLFVSADGSTLQWRIPSNCSSGTSDPSTIGTTYYNTSTNIITAHNSGGDIQTSLPIAIFNSTSNTVDSIDQVFNGFGYIGSTVFALPGVKGLAPNGRNADGSLKNIVFTISSVQTTTDASSATGGYEYYLSGTGIYRQNFGSYEYKPDINYVWDNNANVSRGVMLLDPNAYRDSGKITSFAPKTVFHAVDYSDTEYMAHQAMPSDRYVDLTLGASQTYYTAPADGYFFIVKNGSQNEYCNMYLVPAGSNDRLLGNAVVSNVSGALGSWIAAKKGQRAWVIYTASGSLTYFRFVYAEGAK